MKPWKTLSRRPVYQCGRFITVEQHEVQLPDGQIIPDWTWVLTPDFVTILVQTSEGLFPCFRQIKYAAQGITLAPVGGFIDPGEDPLTAAKRELLEETGYSATEWISLGSFAVDANRGAGNAHLFVAKKAQKVSEPTGRDLEEQEFLLLTREQMETALYDNQFKVLPWATTVSMGLRHV